MLECVDCNDNGEVIYSIMCAFILSFITGIAMIRNELLVYSEPLFKPFLCIDNMEKLNYIGEMIFYLGFLISILSLGLVRINKKSTIILTTVLFNLIFLSNAFVLNGYQFLVAKLILGVCVSASAISVPLYIQKQVIASRRARIILCSALIFNLGHLIGNICLQYNQYLCRVCLLYLLATFFISNPCKVEDPKCLVIKEVLNNSTMYCAILVTTFYGISGPFLGILPVKNDRLFYTIRASSLALEMCLIGFIDRRMLLLTSNLLVVIMSGVRMATGDLPLVRECLIWAYSGGIYPVTVLLFEDLYPLKYAEFGLVLRNLTELWAFIGLSKSNWESKKSFISSVFLLIISAFIYPEPYETIAQDKKH